MSAELLTHNYEDLELLTGGGPRPPTYSFIVPARDEEAVLFELFSRLGPVLEDLQGESEIIVVDDGSRDATWDVIRLLRSRDRRYKGVQLSRSFGKEAALTAGVDLAQGAAVITLDADLQDPPELVVEMDRLWREGYDVVYGYRSERSTDSRLKRATAGLFYRIFNRVSDTRIPPDSADFRLMDRKVVDAVRGLREGHRFFRGICSWVGFRQIGVPYVRELRSQGKSKFRPGSLVRLAADAFLAFSRLPIRAALTATVIAAAALLGCGVDVASGHPGHASPLVLALLCWCGAALFGALGVLALYAARAYERSLARPLYIVRQVAGVARPGAATTGLDGTRQVASFLSLPG